MILNQRQYKITRAQIEKFEQELTSFLASTDAAKMHPVERKLHEDALRSMLETLRAEIAAYEALQSQPPATLDFASLSTIPQALIQARIARGWTQRELAEKLGLKEQQIQRYEATAYQSASLERVGAVMDALGVTAEGHLVTARR